MSHTTYTEAQLTKLSSNYVSGIIEFRDGEQWVKFDSLKAMKVVIDEVRAELFPEAHAKPIGYTRIRVVKEFQ